MDILKKINYFETNLQPRLKKLDRYIKTENDITLKPKIKNKPDNRISHNYAKSIVNNTVGYFMGNPITYNSDNKNLISDLERITKYNDDDTHNVSLATDISKYGIAFELCWHDELKIIKYSKLDCLTCIPIYTDTLDKKLESFIYYYDVYDDEKEDSIRYIDVYDSFFVTHYKSEIGQPLLETGKDLHCFGRIPVNIYKNNEEEKGDYEDVISLIDAYDVMESESLNDFQQFADAYLFISGMSLEEEEVKKLRENKIILGEGTAQWLVKSTNDTYIENIKKRLDTDIYKFSNTVNMSDESFTNNLSGKAIKYKLINMESRIKITENYFKKGLMGRIELICNSLNLKGNAYKPEEITVSFARNIPSDVTDIATLIQMLDGKVSTKTLLTLLPFVEDVEKEISELKKENKEKNLYNPFVNLPDEDGEEGEEEE